MPRPPFATRADLIERHPRDVALLCASEVTRLPDYDRVDAALVDVSTEVRAILARRYSPAQLDLIDDDSAGALKLFAMDMALYRIALSFGRQTEAIKERYEIAVKRLEAIAAGRGGLTFAQGAGAAGVDPQASSPNSVMLEAPERQFTRERLGGI